MSRNIIWENKAVMLGIILFLTKHNKELINVNIIVHNDLFRGITKILFPNLTIKKKGTGFFINIRSSGTTLAMTGLIINNILNLPEIKNKNFYLLPWYDKDNAIVAFIIKTKKLNIETVIKDVTDFSENERLIPHYPENFIDVNCKINMWDSLAEYQILLKYCNLYRVNIIEIYNYISKALSDHTCLFKPQPTKELVYVGIPVPVKVAVPVLVNNNIEQNYNAPNTTGALVTQNVQTNAPGNEPSAEGSCDKYFVIIKKINKKIQALNDFYERK
jgi:hypothetical protein